MKKTFFNICISLCILALASGCTNKNSDTDKTTLTVGIASGYAPFISINAQGVYEGFDIDVITAVAEKMNRSLKLVDLGSMASLFMALNQGSVDALIWGLSITQERCASINMINYYGDALTSYPILFWQEIPQSVTSINDMQGMTICVEPGSAQEAALRTYPLIKILNTEKIDDALLNIQYRKADAALVEPAIAKKFTARFPEIKTLELPLPQERQEQGVGIAVNKNNLSLMNEITQAVNELKNEDRIKPLAQKWGLE